MISLLAFVTLPTWLAIAWRKFLAKQPARPNRSDSPRSILIIRLDQLGDLVLTTPLFRELKRVYPQARLSVAIPTQFKALFTTNRNVDEILTLDEVRAMWLPSRARWLASALWFYWTQLRHRQFDLAVSPRWDVDESLATMLWKGRTRRGQVISGVLGLAGSLAMRFAVHAAGKASAMDPRASFHQQRLGSQPHQ